MSGEANNYDDQGNDLLIIVDSNDNEVGTLGKTDCHKGAGTLHRAFSVFLFDEQGRVLIQQRSANKPLWPLIWANSCCSHPRAGETCDDAAARRIEEELGLRCELDYLYKFEYQAQWDADKAEHELCWVFAGHFSGELTIDPNEIADSRLLTPEELSAAITARPDEFSPWLKLEWARICDDFLDDILNQAA